MAKSMQSTLSSSRLQMVHGAGMASLAGGRQTWRREGLWDGQRDGSWWTRGDCCLEQLSPRSAICPPPQVGA